MPSCRRFAAHNLLPEKNFSFGLLLLLNSTVFLKNAEIRLENAEFFIVDLFFWPMLVMLIIELGTMLLICQSHEHWPLRR